MAVWITQKPFWGYIYNSCSLKLHSKAITSTFKLLFHQIQRYNDKCNVYSAAKLFWPILNNEQIINSVKKAQQKKKAPTL